MLHTTFAKAKKVEACEESYRKMAKALGGVRKYGRDTPIPLDKVLEVCGLNDALWALQIIIEPAEKEVRLLACDYAERVLHLFEERFPKDNRPRQIIEASRQFANGLITKKELNCARTAGAARAAEAGWAAEAAWAADAAWAAGAAARAGWTARAAGAAAEREWQTQRFIKLLSDYKEE